MGQAWYHENTMQMILVWSGLGISFLISVVLMVRLHRSFTRFTPKKQYAAHEHAPSVSICIPARNETHALADCLERVLASTYPKLEILVLDDNSKDDTSHIIKSFAHSGVRFIPGQKLPDIWLGKNFALEQLAREASGTYVVFMDVDTFIQPKTIDRLIGYSISESKDMVSVLPRRNDVGRASVLFGTLRYFLQLTNWWNKNPPVSSSLWMIRRELLLETLGGFASFKNIVEPEGTIAAKVGESYGCQLSNDEIGVTYEKKWRSQVETSKRLLYPFFGQTWAGGIVGVAFLSFITLPLFVLVGGLIAGEFFVAATALMVLTSYTVLYGLYLRWFWQTSWWLGVFLWPYVSLQELILLIASMIGYAWGTITWKGRAVRP